jgi:hypothetical protein
VKIVEHKNKRLRGGHPLEQGTDGPVRSVTLVLERRIATGGDGRQRRQDTRELCPHVGVEQREPLPLQALDVLVKRVDEHPERQVALQLRGRAGQHEAIPGVCTRGELGEQAGLADTGLPDELERTSTAFLEFVEEVVERVELGGPSDEVLGNGHVYALQARIDQGERDQKIGVLP